MTGKLEARSNLMPFTFIFVPRPAYSEEVSASRSVAAKVENWFRRKLVDRARRLLWDQTLLQFVCPVTGEVVPCGPEGKGYIVSAPTELLKVLAPALIWGLIFLRVALATQGLGNVVPNIEGIIADQLNSDLVNQMVQETVNFLGDKVTSTLDSVQEQLGSVVDDGDSCTALETSSSSEHLDVVLRRLLSDTDPEPMRRALHQAYVLVNKAENGGAPDLSPTWTPQQTGLVLASHPSDGSAWVSPGAAKADYEQRCVL
jgi:hypothetical protein